MQILEFFALKQKEDPQQLIQQANRLTQGIIDEMEDVPRDNIHPDLRGRLDLLLSTNSIISQERIQREITKICNRKRSCAPCMSRPGNGGWYL